MIDPIFEEPDAMRSEIAHLRRLAAMTTDDRVLTEIQALIDVLEHRLRILPDGHGTAL
jgi:hypothetical protein